MASASSGGRFRLSAVARNSLRMYETVFSATGCAGAPGWPICTGVAAPIVPPSAMAMFSAARLISAPAEMARLLMKATVRTRRLQQGVADEHRGIHAPAEGVDLQNDGRGLGVGRLIEDALHERGEPEVDHPRDRHHVDHRSRGLGASPPPSMSRASSPNPASRQRPARPRRRLSRPGTPHDPATEAWMADPSYPSQGMSPSLEQWTAADTLRPFTSPMAVAVPARPSVPPPRACSPAASPGPAEPFVPGGRLGHAPPRAPSWRSTMRPWGITRYRRHPGGCATTTGIWTTGGMRGLPQVPAAPVDLCSAQLILVSPVGGTPFLVA